MNKKPLIELSLERKKDVLDDLKNGKSCRILSEKYGISKSTVSNIGKRRKEILDAWERNCDAERRRKMRKTENEETNMKVLNFFNECRARKIPVTGPMLQEAALKIAAKLEDKSFSASNGWLEKFRIRNNIQFSTLSGTAADVDPQSVIDWKRKLPSIISGYQPENIFNADESGFFYRQLPTKSLTIKGEKCKGGKKAKDRITVLFCCSMKGEKLTPLVIGNAENPRIFKKMNVKPSDLPVLWHSNKKSWMTSIIFSEWLKKINIEMKRKNRKILLFVDNATSHCPSLYSNIKIEFLPSNTTSELQPLDQGVIETVKRFYRKFLVERIVSEIFESKSEDSATELCRKVTVLDAIEWIIQSWEKVKVSTIAKCFHKAGFSIPNMPAIENDDSDIPDFDDKICQEFELTSIHEMDKLDDKLIVHEDTDQSTESILNGLFMSPSSKESHHYNSDTEHCDSDSESEETNTYETSVPPKFGDVLSAFSCIKAYAYSKNADSLLDIYNLETKLTNTELKNKQKNCKQAAITKYFTSG